MDKKNLLFVFLFSSIIIFSVTSNTEAQAVEKHHLKITSQPRDLMFISGQGFYESGQIVTLTEMPETWREYGFVGWKIDGGWASENPPKIRMDKSHTAIAIFEILEDKLVDKEGILIDSIPRISTIIVDDEVYLPEELPITLQWEEGTNHIILVEPIVNDGADKRYVFDKWKDSETDTVRTVYAGELDSLIAIFNTEYYLRAITEYNSINGGGWYGEGETATFELTSEFAPRGDDESIRYAFESWDSGDYLKSVENSIPIHGPITVKANWDEEYLLDIRSNIPDYIPPGGGFYPQGKSLALISEEEIRSSAADINYVFDKWVSIGPNPVIISNTISPSTTITIENPYIIEARYAKSYLINAWSEYGSISGGGFYDAGDIAEIKIITNEVIVEPGKIKKVFSGWNTYGANIMDFSSESKSLEKVARSNLLVVVDQPRNVTTQWKNQYYLDIRSSEGEVEGAGWYDPGTYVPITAKNPVKSPSMWSTYSFVGWSGDIDNTSNNAKIIMSGPKLIVAEWEIDNTPGIINGAILAGIGIAGFFTYAKTKNRVGLAHIIDTKRNDMPFYRRGLASLVGKKSKPKFGGSAKTETLPVKKFSIFDWLMGNDKN